MIKVAFLGSPGFVQPIREELAKHFTLTESLNKADLVVVAAYGRILTKNELNAPKYGCINVHPSLLPKYRGPSPIQAAILNGDKVSGITIIKMDEKVDHGPIIYQESFEILSSDNFDTLSKKMFQRASAILPQVIKDFISGKINYPAAKLRGIPSDEFVLGHSSSKQASRYSDRKIKLRLQNNAIATYCNQLTKSDGYINLANPPPKDLLERMIRAYHPWPNVWTRLRLGKGSQAKLKIVKFLPEGKIQVEGGKPMSYKDFVNGYPEAKRILLISEG